MQLSSGINPHGIIENSLSIASVRLGYMEGATILLIVGTGFSSIASNNLVVIKDKSYFVIAATPTQLDVRFYGDRAPDSVSVRVKDVAVQFKCEIKHQNRPIL